MRARAIPEPVRAHRHYQPPDLGINPGGLTAGYDSDAVNTTVSSGGPGSVFVNFEPSFSGQSLPSGQQALGRGDAYTLFTLTQSQVCDLAVAFTVSGGPAGLLRALAAL